MAVQQNKKSTNKRGNHRAHDFLTNPPTAIEATTGEVHRRHHISPTGFYRGKKVIATKRLPVFSTKKLPSEAVGSAMPSGKSLRAGCNARTPR